MRLALDMGGLALLLAAGFQGYRQRAPWFTRIAAGLMAAVSNRGFFRRFLILAPVFVGWLLLCHWTDVRGFHATAAGLMALAMAVGLDAMRQFEESRHDKEEQP